MEICVVYILLFICELIDRHATLFKNHNLLLCWHYTEPTQLLTQSTTPPTPLSPVRVNSGHSNERKYAK